MCPAVMAESHLKAAPQISPRPLSPHLTVWRPTITYVMSIAHRITGAALYFGMALFAWWLMAAAIGPGAFETANAVFGSWFGRLVLLGFTWAFLHHLLGGVRHLIWDTGAGYSEPARNGLAWATIIGSILLTLLVWIAAYMVR
jgi:succinate dehydrogenase / fumarate reductase cytochrome b subunit